MTKIYFANNVNLKIDVIDDFTEANIFEEPSAVVSHAGICRGALGYQCVYVTSENWRSRL